MIELSPQQKLAIIDKQIMDWTYEQYSLTLQYRTQKVLGNVERCAVLEASIAQCITALDLLEQERRQVLDPVTKADPIPEEEYDYTDQNKQPVNGAKGANVKEK